MKIVGVTHPIPSEYAERIYNENKTVFVGKRCLCKVSEGNKFIIYESHGARSYTSWADIKFIGKIKTSSVMKQYGEKLMISQKEFKEYSEDRKGMFVIEFENFEKFNKPVKPDRYITVAGRYIYEDEFKIIKKNKD